MKAGLPLSIAIERAPSPLALLERVAQLPYPVLLDAAADPNNLGRWSYLGWDPVALIEATAEQWDEIATMLRASCQHEPPENGLPPFCGGWMGWLSYELGRAFDRQPIARNNGNNIPDISLALYDLIVAWDHHEERAWVVSTGVDGSGNCDPARAEQKLEQALAIIDGTALVGAETEPHKPPALPSIETHSNFLDHEYRQAVLELVEEIRSGNIFQANLAQQFTAPFSGSKTTLYRSLRANAAGSHAAFIDRGKIAALSMSPERFLRYDSRTRQLETRPIKGTRPRGNTAELDARNAAELVASQKDRAENVMIVDLMRNDLSKVAKTGSIAVKALCRLESYAAVHHLVSVVEASLAQENDFIDLIEASYPGGSITGAPKLRAMELIARLEPDTRGIYCGAIGWLGLDGSLDLNIAIRTVTIANGKATVGAGGGVTILSDPEEEYQESVTKARALITAIEAAQ